jgi:hypothetical protein
MIQREHDILLHFLVLSEILETLITLIKTLAGNQRLDRSLRVDIFEMLLSVISLVFYDS